MPEIVLDSANLPPRPPHVTQAAAEEMTQRIPDVSRARRHIIKRPRLTRLLDETSARIILLVAPAGYGKTTLAREWLEGSGRPYAWYGATPASVDVAALSRGIARALGEIAPDAESRVAARLRVRETPVDGATLAELLLDELGPWPEGFWLAIDDYHLFAADPSCNAFMTLFIERSSPQLLLGTRHRPEWATARRILYGEISEVGRESLAFTKDEGIAVLARHSRAPAPGLLALAQGWPAVVGLAAITGHVDLPEGSLPDPLHEYIARELFQSASDTTRHWLPRIAISDRPTKAVTVAVAGGAAAAVLEEALALELCTIDEGVVELHPLFLQFLRRQLTQLDEQEFGDLAHKVADVHLMNGDPAEAFAVAAKAGLLTTMVAILESSYDAVLAEGRLSTVAQWVTHARKRAQHPSLDVVEAEVAFAEGDFERAEVLADRALRELPAEHPLGRKARLRAAYSAYFRQDERAALQHFIDARELARTQDEITEALWGQFLCFVLLDIQKARAVLRMLEAQDGANEDEHVVRIAQGRLELAHRSGNVDEALELAQRARHLLPYVDSHMRRTGFLNSLATTLASAARFDEAIKVATEEIDEAQRFRLTFALPHAHGARALGYLGLGRFREAEAEILRARATIAPTDGHSEANVRCIYARLELARGRVHAALSTLSSEPPEGLTEGMLGEYQATHALALLAADEAREARAEAARATRTAPFGESLVLAAGVRAGAAIREDLNAADGALDDLVREVERSGNRGALLTVFRAYPRLLPPLLKRMPTWGGMLLATAHDKRIATAQGVNTVAPAPELPVPLTPRQEEVLALVARGMRNREISRMLFIEEVTVKVHIRNILRKLNLRSRTEAAVYLHQRDRAADISSQRLGAPEPPPASASRPPNDTSL
jgi:LuxR family transcriptional regulator, maltose regulon positive regulatory protein